MLADDISYAAAAMLQICGLFGRQMAQCGCGVDSKSVSVSPSSGKVIVLPSNYAVMWHWVALAALAVNGLVSFVVAVLRYALPCVQDAVGATAHNMV